MRSSLYAAFALTCAALAANGSRPVAATGSFVRFEDPLERAFSLDVPSRWAVHGGMFRLGYSDFRPMLDLKSPDGKSNIRSGDIAVPRAYAQPVPSHPKEGELDDLGAQARLIFATYRSGKEYATLYALARFKAFCGTLTPQAADWTPPSSEGGNATASAGSVAYRCAAKDGGTRTAYVYAMTERTSSTGALWHVSSLVSFIAPPQRVESVHAIIARGANSFRLYPSWIADQKNMEAAGLRYQIARQHRRMAEIGRQVADFTARMRGMQAQVDGFERGQAARRSEFSGFDDAVNGVTPTVDPLDGRTRNVWTGPKNGYWVNGAGTIVNSNVSPGADYRALQPQ